MDTVSLTIQLLYDQGHKDTAIGKHNREGWVGLQRSLDKATDKNPTKNQTLVNVQYEITINQHHYVGYWNN